MFKVNNRNTRSRCEIYSNFATPGVVLVSLLLSLSSVSIVNFKQVNAGWVLDQRSTKVKY